MFFNVLKKILKRENKPLYFNEYDHLKGFEALVLKAYKCPAGVVTIGYGHTKTARMGMEITEKQADKLLKTDLEWAEEAVRNLVVVSINQPQYNALVSFVFNVGISAFSKSTMLKKINKKDFKGASNEFQKWKFANGRILKGLIRRRQSEQEMFDG
jgi:lysozyme